MKPALEDVRRAIKLDRHFVPAHAFLGEIACAARRFDHARRFIDRAVALDPSYAPAHAYQAMILAAEQPDRPGDVLEALDRCVELDPLPDIEKSATATYAMRAVAFLDVGNHRAALANAYVAYKLEPERPLHSKLIRDAYSALGKKRLATDFAARVAPTVE